MATPTVVAMTTCTTKAPAAPSHTCRGRPRVAMTRLANMVLSGSSPMKMMGNTASAISGFTTTTFPTKTDGGTLALGIGPGRTGLVPYNGSTM